MKKNNFVMVLLIFIILLMGLMSFVLYQNMSFQKFRSIKDIDVNQGPMTPTSDFLEETSTRNRITLKSPINISLEIPHLASISATPISSDNEDWGIEIDYQNLGITYCTGCDWMGYGCGGIDFDECVSEKTYIGNVRLSEYFLKSNPQYLVRAVGHIEMSDFKTLELLIDTEDHQRLTNKERELINLINSSIQNN